MEAELDPARVDSIGTVAGSVWRYLSESGPVTLSRLARDVAAPRDLVMQAVGWLAREDKVEFQEGRRSKTVSLK
ncbi:MAG: winged helix-turn-helix domain-containing protein [Planctomycetes bacterium]|nr:winged helix-turn-helix domain-containing protein [Planctomycetota bacterium]